MDRRSWQKLGRLSGVTSVVVMIGSGLWAGGCSSDSDQIVCDANGCRSCNGYGCKDVPPPLVDAGKYDSGPLTDAGKTDSGTPPSQCRYPSECPQTPPHSCVNGQCVPSCTGNTPGECGNGKKCVNNVCQPDPGQPQCQTDPNCADGGTTPKCRGGRCVPQCDPANPKCPDGTYCDEGGACIPDTRPKPNCSATDMSNCKSDQQCIEGYCRYRCEDDATCKRIDSRIQYCGVDKVCRTYSEAHPQCTNGGCTSPQVCIDNVCK